MCRQIVDVVGKKLPFARQIFDQCRTLLRIIDRGNLQMGAARGRGLRSSVSVGVRPLGASKKLTHSWRREGIVYAEHLQCKCRHMTAFTCHNDLFKTGPMICAVCSTQLEGTCCKAC
jgi:hypothetical protein